MGKVQIDHTGSGGGITLSSDGTDLLLDGSAVGGSAVGGSTGVDFNDNVKIRLGTGNDAELFFDASNLNIDTAGDIILDSSDGDWKFKDDGTDIIRIQNIFTDVHITLNQQDRELFFRGNDGGSTITALKLSMGSAGFATFNSGASFGGSVTATTHESSGALTLKSAAGSDLTINHGDRLNLVYQGLQYGEVYRSSGFNIENKEQDTDIIFKGNDGGSTITALTLDMSDAGKATFNSSIQTGGTVNVNGAYTLPTSDGSANQVLTTDGSGAVTFASAGGASSNTGTGNFIGGTNAGDALESGGQYNTLLGQESGTNLTTGDQNVAVGYESLQTAVSGTSNVAIGYRALKVNTAHRNIAIGVEALSSNTSGEYNNASGFRTLFRVTTGSNNIGLGYLTGQDITTGSHNIFLGNEAGDNTTTADYNVAIGSEALHGNDSTAQTGNSNVAIGHQAGHATTTGQENVYIGKQAGLHQTANFYSVYIGRLAGAGTSGNSVAANQNVGIGNEALYKITTGDINVAIGNNAGYAITTGTLNTIVGGLAGDAITTGERNVIAGHNAGGALTVGGSNTAIGDRALLADTQGSNSVAIGRNALFAQNFTSATDAYNVAIGRDAGASITTGEKNTLIGGLAGDALTDTDANVAIGFNALGSDTLGTKSVAIGEGALFTQNFTSATTTYNTAVGTDAGVAVTTGTRNTLIGAEAGDAITTGTRQTALGYKALGANTDGVDNVALGDGALTADTRGCRTVAIGRDAFATQNFTSATDVHSVAVGYAAGQIVSTGDKNTLIGSLAGDAITTGSNNTLVGMGTETSSATTDYEIVLGKGTIGMGGSNFTFGKDNGSDRVYNQFSSNATFTRVSDERYKKEIQTNIDCGLDFINDLRTVTFKFKAKSEIPDTLPDYDAEATTPEHPDKLYGVIAQEVKTALDSHNITDFGGHHEDPKTGIQGVAQSMFIYPLIKAVQELSAKNDALEARIAALES